MATISDILRHKADDGRASIVGVTPSTSVRELARTLAGNRIGAVVVTDEDGGLAGIVSERDVVRHLATEVAADGDLDAAVSQIMTATVVTCGRDDALEQIAETMTQRRIRHMPVLDQGRIVGIVSIGDVVSNRIRQLEQDRVQLEQYIAG